MLGKEPEEWYRYMHVHPDEWKPKFWKMSKLEG